MSALDIAYLFCTGVAAVFGLIVGSFLNVCIYRIPKKISIITGNKGRSMCTTCGHVLRWYDLVPLFSYLFLGGKCRYCKDHISLRYPLVEGLNMLLWALCMLCFGPGIQFVIYSLFFSVLIVIAMIDYDTQEIPYRLQICIVLLAVISAFFTGFAEPTARFIGVLVVGVPLAIMCILGGIGGGDVQLMAASALLLGWKQALIALFLGIVFGGIYGIVILLLKKRKKGSRISFGPFLALGLVIAVLIGDQIIAWYMSLLI